MRSELTYLGNPVIVKIIQRFIYRKLYCFTDPSEGMVLFNCGKMATLKKKKPEVYLEPSEVAKMELFAKIVNGF